MKLLSSLLAYATSVSLCVIAARVPVTNRAVANQGWSLQASSCPAGSRSCGSGACCPSSSNCQTTGNGEVMACCPTTSNCRGSVEGGPTCADASWSLWKGQYSNGFCCQVGQVGAFRYGDATAGSCYTSVPSGFQAAELATAGTGGGSPPSSSTTTSKGTTPSTTTTASSSNPTGAPGKPVMTQAEATQDVIDGRNVGFTAFALNTHTITDQFATDAFDYLFSAADANNFKLFISFDTSWGLIHPADIPAFLVKYTSRNSYYKVGGKPFVSTFRGGNYNNDQWTNDFRNALIQKYQVIPYFVPDFDDWSGWPNNVVKSFPVIDGAFSWESAWPPAGNTVSNVSSSVDQNMLQQAHGAQKTYMMPLSPFQFKYGSDKWYRTGDSNFPQRMEQILTLQPDFVELITWNDAGEGHYVGNLFPEAIACCPDIQAYTNGFNHNGWQQLITPFIKAYQQGQTDISKMKPLGTTPVGSLWYRTELVASSCTDIQNHGQGQDVVNFAVVLPSSGYTINVYSNNNRIGSFAGKAGLNYNSVPGLQAGGGQRLEVLNSANTKVAAATGTKDVTSGSGKCNWNYEVVGLS